MGSKVMVVFKILPEEPESIDAIEKALHNIKTGKLEDLKKEPLAFGLSTIRAGITIQDKVDGLMEKLEEEIKNIPGVGQAEVEMITLI
ncbi:MAG: elongation factor 1-beta [archaeon]|nr:elongation factor 1-beta [archaeon]